MVHLQKFPPNLGRIGCVRREPGDKSYKPQFFFSISMKNGCLVTTVFNFVIKFAWTFFFYHYMLGTTVWRGLNGLKLKMVL